MMSTALMEWNIDAIIGLDGTTLNEDRVQTLVTVMPNDTELKAVADYDGDITRLRSAEQFVRLIVKIPRCGDRLKCYLFRLRFPTIVQDINTKLVTLATSAQLLRESASFRKGNVE
jgi:hypothetical protein